MDSLPTIEDVKKRDKELYTQILEKPSIVEHKILKSFIIGKADQLLKDISKLSPNVTSIDDYTWLNNTILRWQVVFSSILNTPRDIQMPPPPQKLEVELTPKSEQELNRWLEDTAYYLAKIRVTEDLKPLLKWLEREIEYRMQRPSSPEEHAQDWYNAEVLLAAEILEGKINFSGQIVSESYKHLENVWLKDVKQLKAYFIWENEGRRLWWAEDDYYRACEKIRRMLSDPSIKGSLSDFQEAKAYLETRYLTCEEMDGHKRYVINETKPEVENLIRTKAHRVWATCCTRDDPIKNWQRAKTYVKMFYENIIPAVTENDREKVLLVLKAFQYSKAPENRYLIINCFEAALAIYFLKSAIILEHVEKARGKAEPESYTKSVAKVQSWPGDFIVPSECEDRFTYDKAKGEIHFERVMTELQKNALLAKLTKEEHKEAVESLFEQSRLLIWEMIL